MRAKLNLRHAREKQEPGLSRHAWQSMFEFRLAWQRCRKIRKLQRCTYVQPHKVLRELILYKPNPDPPEREVIKIRHAELEPTYISWLRSAERERFSWPVLTHSTVEGYGAMYVLLL
ncbi:hypothetical protein RRG08_025894 [Elysia crispata]|uniref:Uncharacterized protein n=1 Tax=Elysia crispata TaxID=231223 RepID=A0AAE0ZPH9_9GAST|nr:hypothetical protein RRG08_025894 [Elysia crispata]